VIVRLFN